MTLQIEVLGEAGRDNALLVKVDSGQAVHRLLFDCGDGCLKTLSTGDIQSIDHLFFSHFHMDHVAGFDQYFRCNFSRTQRPNVIWGPVGSAAILQHRFQGFTWNLAHEMNATWIVREISTVGIQEFRFSLNEAFSIAHNEGQRTCGERIHDSDTWTVSAWPMDHRTPSMAYVVQERPRENFRVEEMRSLGLTAGPWLRQLRDPENRSETIMVQGREMSTEQLRRQLIEITPGASVAYLTDFVMDNTALEFLAEKLQQCDTIVCESQYRHSDLELAVRNYHMTGVLAAKLADKAKAQRLVLFHLSDRYTPDVWIEMLREAQEIFPATTFASHWNTEFDTGACPDHRKSGEQP